MTSVTDALLITLGSPPWDVSHVNVTKMGAASQGHVTSSVGSVLARRVCLVVDVTAVTLAHSVQVRCWQNSALTATAMASPPGVARLLGGSGRS